MQTQAKKRPPPSSASRDMKDGEIWTQQNMELPHTRDGEVDWMTLGNILAAHILGEVVCASYVDPVYGKKLRNGFEADTDWQFAYKEHQVVVLRKVFKDSPIKSFMGRGIIDAPIEDVVDFVSTHEGRLQWDKYCVDIGTAVTISEIDQIVYMHSRANHCLVKAERDFCFFDRTAFVDGKYVQTAMSVEHPDCPLVPGLTRAQIRPGSGFVVEPYLGSTSRTLVTYLAHLDLVSLPPVITNRVMRRQPMSIRYIKEILSPSSPMARTWSYSSVVSNEQSVHNESGETESQHLFSSSGRHYEDPVPFRTFTQFSRHASVPGDTTDSMDSSTAKTDQPWLAVSDTALFQPVRRCPPQADSKPLGAEGANTQPLHLSRKPNFPVSTLKTTPEREEEEEKEGEGEEEEREEESRKLELAGESKVLFHISHDSSGSESVPPANSTGRARPDTLTQVPQGQSFTNDLQTRSAPQNKVTQASCPRGSPGGMRGSSDILSRSSSGDSFHTALVGPTQDSEALSAVSGLESFVSGLKEEKTLSPLSSQYLSSGAPPTGRPESQVFNTIVSL